jgi:hypothetical protein
LEKAQIVSFHAIPGIPEYVKVVPVAVEIPWEEFRICTFV